MSSVLTVSQLNNYISFKLRSDLKLKGIAVKGEISNFTVHYKSKHAYFTVKDENSAVKAVMFSNNFSRLKFMPENGMSVLVIGNVEVYERGGIYQIIATEITPLGAGLMHTQIELVKEKLRKSGIFDISRKKAIPLVPKKIAVVTSLTGAALQDVLHIVQRRYPLCTVDIFPAQVQGSCAVDSICQALSEADRDGADTIILARGGGSPEDLMPFNSEKVVLAVANCNTPLISAVGHETDTSLCDYAADKRAPTPSAAAELATPDKQEIINSVIFLKSKLDRAVKRIIENRLEQINSVDSKLNILSPDKKLAEAIKRSDELRVKLDTLMERKLEILSLNLDSAVSQLQILSPLNVLERGYSITQKNGRTISSVNEISSGDRLTIRLSDGCLQADVIDTQINPKG